jgi:hypothetical protein
MGETGAVAALGLTQAEEVAGLARPISSTHSRGVEQYQTIRRGTTMPRVSIPSIDIPKFDFTSTWSSALVSPQTVTLSRLCTRPQA